MGKGVYLDGFCLFLMLISPVEFEPPLPNYVDG
jgi:hypothetical protein